MSEPTSPRQSVLRYARALFVVFHVVAITLMASPSAGGGMNRAAWNTPTVQDEFEVWASRLRDWGLGLSAEQLKDTLWGFVVQYEAGRREALRPFGPYLRTTGSVQSWRMFVAPHRYPGRLVVEVRRQGEPFEHVYVARSGEHTWMRAPLDHTRMRSAVFRYAWKHIRRGRVHFVDWLAREAAEDFPDAERIRVSFERFRTPSAAETRAGVVPKTRRVLANVRELAPLRADTP